MRSLLHALLLTAVFTTAATGFNAVSALELRDAMVVTLHAEDGTSIPIGRLVTQPADAGHTFRFDLDPSPFTDEFLSMRPFKCLQGPKGRLCYLPYPYENARRIADGDLIDLEYDLLFVRQLPGEHGINAWNGVYYRLSASAKGLEGALHEVDLNLLATPPSAGNTRPIAPTDLHQAEPVDHWLPRLTIE